MNAYKIANILYNMGLDMDYMDYKDCWETEIHALEDEIFKLKQEGNMLFFTLETIAFNHERYFDLHTKEDDAK